MRLTSLRSTSACNRAKSSPSPRCSPSGAAATESGCARRTRASSSTDASATTTAAPGLAKAPTTPIATKTRAWKRVERALDGERERVRERDQVEPDLDVEQRARLVAAREQGPREEQRVEHRGAAGDRRGQGRARLHHHQPARGRGERGGHGGAQHAAGAEHEASEGRHVQRLVR
jgi:hypothetical protein